MPRWPGKQGGMEKPKRARRRKPDTAKADLVPVARVPEGTFFDNVRHDRLLAKVAQRVDDADVMHLLKVMLKASGKHGVPQGGVISPLLSNIYLTEVDRMLERAREATRYGKYTSVEYARLLTTW